MASNQNFLLTPQQQELLFAALNANRPVAGSAGISPNTAVADTPATTKPADLINGIADSSFLDYDYSFDGADTSLDFSLGGGDQTSFLDNEDGDVDDARTDSAPSNAENDSPDKRSHPDDEEEEDGAASAKRHESTEKVPKKPGRKPLTSEPSSKRKAQNRAAQRAFRERKEKHLKDLETKVAELEKASETANNENDVLRAQVEKMTVELNEYKKRMELLSRSRTAYSQGSSRPVFGNSMINNINDVSFQFEFPKFGQLPGPSPTAATPAPTTNGNNSNNNSPSALSNYKRGLSFDTLNTPSPVELPGLSTSATSNANSPTESINGLKKTTKDDLSKLSNVFTPPLTNVITSRSSMDSGSTSSPSASSHTNTAPSSSCGTSPEPYTQSPMGFKPVDTMATIGEEQTAMFANTNTNQDISQFANVDISDMSWLNGQTNFQFDPQLFGDYREPQENILASGGFDDSFFNDALEVDFTTPFNMAPSPLITTTAKANSLIAQIDAAKEGEFASSSIAGKAGTPPVPILPANGAMLTCNKIWERLQNCPQVKNGDFDLDGLCSDLQKKAKCSGSGAVVDEKDFKFVMDKYLDKDDQKCTKDLLAEVKAPIS
ncbi:DNA-binding transcription factor yap1 [Sporothrix curviconia]|uniref:DNA-binding transcription factor yap1 n=1 Tax=Sporothrix curviconia TaxID=1260050 RepID=A0ABP0BUJ9_9PEZI